MPHQHFWCQKMTPCKMAREQQRTKHIQCQTTRPECGAHFNFISINAFPIIFEILSFVRATSAFLMSKNDTVSDGQRTTKNEEHPVANNQARKWWTFQLHLNQCLPNHFENFSFVRATSAFLVSKNDTVSDGRSTPSGKQPGQKVVDISIASQSMTSQSF